MWLRTLVLLTMAAYVVTTLLLVVKWQALQAPAVKEQNGDRRALRQTVLGKADIAGGGEEDSVGGGGDDVRPLAVWGDDFACLGWVQTDDDWVPTGETRDCWTRVRGGEAGFCAIQNATSGEIYRVMRTTRKSLKEEVRFTCRLARPFSDFQYLMKSYQHDPPMSLSGDHHTIETHSATQETNGIVIAVYEAVLASAYASIRHLRAIGCQLPIELWFRGDELRTDHPLLRHLVHQFGPIKTRVIYDERIHGYYVKAHAVYYSSFRNVLLLDADNFAVRDPTYLFESNAFQQFGALFWPDFWHPGNTIFNVHSQSLLWELLGIEYVDMLEQESGQAVIDRRRCKEALNRLMFFSSHQPHLLNKLLLVWGDKDLFRLAWMTVNQDFYYNDSRVPGAVGIINPRRHRFCGMSMAQYDLEGQGVLFVHRNTVKFAVGRPHNQKRLWQVLQEYEPGIAPEIQSFSGKKVFNETSCFGVRRYVIEDQSLVHMTAVSSISTLNTLETKLLEYVEVAANYLPPNQAEST